MICNETRMFSTLFTRHYSEKEVELSWTPAPLELPDDMHTKVLEHWDTLPKDHIFNGRLARLDHWSFTSKGCRFVLRPSDYRTLLFSNNYVQHICDSWGSAFLSRVLGISSVVISSDDDLVFMKRSANVGEYPECYDVFGGHIDVPQNGEAPNVFASMAQELEEEAGLLGSDYDLSLLGLIESTPNKKPELVFMAKAHLTTNQILSRARAAKDHIEFSQLHTLENGTPYIKDFLKAHQGEFSPSAFGSFCVYMRTCFN